MTSTMKSDPARRDEVAVELSGGIVVGAGALACELRFRRWGDVATAGRVSAQRRVPHRLRDRRRRWSRPREIVVWSGRGPPRIRAGRSTGFLAHGFPPSESRLAEYTRSGKPLAVK